CNSAYYGVRVPIQSLQQAIVTIGYRELKKMLLISGSLRYFKGDCAGYEGQYGELLMHSVATALLSQRLGQRLEEAPDDLFVAGLLHDIGKLILGSYVEDQFQVILKTVRDDGLPFHEAEYRILGISHDAVGKHMLEYWGFPEAIVAVVGNHHQTDVNRHPDNVLLVALADRLTGFLGVNTFNDGLHYEGFATLCKHFSLQLDDIEHLLSETVKEFSDIMAAFA
ncbi:MAG TPA: HDOD domain-containing protein, partial [bacterium]|nr:HDOD domain-containing protein [bacterium]